MLLGGGEMELTWLPRLLANTCMLELLIACLMSDLPDLRSLPGVESVEVTVECDDPRLTIIHIRDWHHVDKGEIQDRWWSGAA